jgi:hypothetical protein
MNDNIRQIIESGLNVQREKMKGKGEVFTPIPLINEMLDVLPQSVWGDQDLKWLDPAGGLGNFMVIIYFRLMVGLSFIKDNSERSKHIIEKMLFMVEIDSENVKKSVDLFKQIDGACIPNIIQEDFTNYKEDKYNIIVGNPPYNLGGVRSKIGVKTGIYTLWTTFIDKSLRMLEKDGYLLFITPNSWTALTSPLSKRMIKYNIQYVKNYTYATSLELFGKQAGKLPLAWFLIQNNMPSETLIWDSKWIPFNIYKYKFIPNLNASLIKKVIEKVNGVDLNSYWHSTERKLKNTYKNEMDETFVYPLVNYSYNNINVYYSNKKYKFNNDRPKLILSNFSMGYPLLDLSGKYDARAHMCYVIMIDNNDINALRRIQKLLLTPLSFTIINSLKISQNYFHYRTFQLLPDVTKLDIDIDDKSLYNYFNLDENDLKVIDHQLTHGEGNLTLEQKEYILNYRL